LPQRMQKFPSGTSWPQSSHLTIAVLLAPGGPSVTGACVRTNHVRAEIGRGAIRPRVPAERCEPVENLRRGPASQNVLFCPL
jgi:hypothetical protein